MAPAERTAVITNKPVLDINFSQFRAKVSGTITCMGMFLMFEENQNRKEKKE